MILLFSEGHADYSRYHYPYIIWAMPEPGESPADLFHRGFLPAPQLDRFYLCRNIRVILKRYNPSSENRRILRKGAGIDVELIPRERFDYSAARRQAWKTFADHRFGTEVMGFDRLDRLMGSPVISHLLQFTDRTVGREVGTALLFLAEPEIAYYYYAFYDLEYLPRSLGMFMMTRAVELFAQRGVASLHLGTCYSKRALYKTQFAGVEFFNGFRWSDNLDELKFILTHHVPAAGQHLLEQAEFRDTFYPDSLDQVARGSSFQVHREGGRA